MNLIAASGLSVSGLQTFLLSVVGIALLGVAITIIFKAAKGQHSHAFSSGIAIVIAVVVVALAGSITIAQAFGANILSLFGI